MRNILKAALVLFIVSAILVVITTVLWYLVSPDAALFPGMLGSFGLMVSSVLFLVWLVPKTVRKAYAWYISKSNRVKIYLIIALPVLFVLLIRLTLFLLNGR